MRNANLLHELSEILTIVDPEHLIPVLEKGLEIEKLLSNDPESELRIRDSRMFLCFLYDRRLGLK